MRRKEVKKKKEGVTSGIWFSCETSSSREKPLFVESRDSSFARNWTVHFNCRTVFERKELFFSFHLKANQLFGEREHVENEQFVFYPIHFLWLHFFPFFIHMRNHFVGNVLSFIFGKKG